MDAALEFFGLVAGAITSLGFIPQLVRGYRTKKLEDVSYYMPIVLAFGMFALFADIEFADGTVIPHHAGPDFTFLPFLILEGDDTVVK